MLDTPAPITKSEQLESEITDLEGFVTALKIVRECGDAMKAIPCAETQHAMHTLIDAIAAKTAKLSRTFHGEPEPRSA
jgi:hypothetical protein